LKGEGREVNRKIVLLTYTSILLLSCVGVSIQFIKPVRAAATWTVDDDGPADFTSVQDAINAASDGDTIQVRAGTYYENLVVNKTVSLVGENRSTTIIYGDGTRAVILATGNCFVVRDFTIQNGTSGIYLRHSNGSVIRENNVNINHWGPAIGVVYCLNTFIINNTVNNNSHPTSSEILVDGISLGGSTKCLLSGNDVTNNSGRGISLVESSNNVLRHNNMSDNHCNFLVWGDSLEHYIQDIDSSNTVDGKPIYYLINQKSFTVNQSTHPSLGYLALVNSTNVVVEDLKPQNNGLSVFFAYTTDSIVRNVSTINYWFGIGLACSYNCSVQCSMATNNYGDGILLWHSSNCSVSLNNVTNSGYGISLGESQSNFIYHNNFINNTEQVEIGLGYYNTWDGGYPSGGNYWSDHNPPDEDSDKIGDDPYFINENNTDRYPLIYPYGFVPNPDVNDDEIVNILDISTVAMAFGCKPGDLRWNPIVDMDLNETINILDLSTVAMDYGKTV